MKTVASDVPSVANRPIKSRSFERHLNAFADELAGIPDTRTRQVQVLQFLNQYTGSTFSGFNLEDELGRIINAVVWPLTEERARQLGELTQRLSPLAMATVIHELMWIGPNRAWAIPDTLFHSHPAYLHVYRPLGIHNLAVYFFPQQANRTTVVALITRGDRNFTSGELRKFQSICDQFAQTIQSIAPSGNIQPMEPKPEDHLVLLDEQLRPRIVPAYAHALLSLFYGSMRVEAGVQLLPTELEEAIASYRIEHFYSRRTTQTEVYYAFTKRHRGRQLCITVQSATGHGYRLICHEDLSQLPRIRRLKDACLALRRDRFAVMAAGFALLDGIQLENEILRRAALQSLKPASAARIVSCARRIVEQL